MKITLNMKSEAGTGVVTMRTRVFRGKKPVEYGNVELKPGMKFLIQDAGTGRCALRTRTDMEHITQKEREEIIRDSEHYLNLDDN